MLRTLLLATLLFSQTESPTLGMTDEQVFRLGGVEFVNRYSEKFGSSTAAMCDGWETYAKAARRLNDAALRKKPAALQSAVKALRSHLGTFRNEMCDIGRAFSGGGTIWNIAYSETAADVEDTVSLLSQLRMAKLKPLKVSAGTQAMSRVEAVAKENAKDIDSYKASGGGMDEVRSSLKSARAEYAKIVKIAAKLNRAQSDAVLAFCVEAAQVPLNQFEGG